MVQQIKFDVAFSNERPKKIIRNKKPRSVNSEVAKIIESVKNSSTTFTEVKFGDVKSLQTMLGRIYHYRRHNLDFKFKCSIRNNSIFISKI